ncbi:hypothetical protein Pmani_028623 [Petrolisthes manimaculis]|uniref:PPM-type phosphatase domain-containing protein n=1 Tax=Petrolisthes manimaculis TaxID=1843537 RepID=A0AAE1P0V0_9EUCA|nr:hypothetical protein Pmani_028623 [Petrolisthes manimaculis]
MPSASRVGVNLRASAYLHQGDRKYMEDEFQVAYQRTHDKKDIEYAFFGIFDGHGGKEAAHFAKDHLMDNIVSLRAFWSDNDEDVLTAIKEGFLQTHLAMWKVLDQWPRTASGWPSTSGTTASVAFIRRQKIYIGHVGDSGIVLGYEDQSGAWHGQALTRDHKPESVAEKARIAESGGKVIIKSGVPRVVWNRPKSGHQGPVRRSTPMDEIPFLAVARSLGDLWSYNATNDQFVVSPEPDVYVMSIDITQHRCLIFGTDGLWNVLTPDAAVGVAHQAERNNEKHYLGIPNSCGKQRLWVNPSRSVVFGALGRYLKLNLRADNTSAVTVFLDPPGRPKREVLLQQKGMKKGTSPPKPFSRMPPVDSETKNKDALVHIHMYNQNQALKQEGNRGVLRIKERLPEKWQAPTDNQGGDPDSDQGGTVDTGQDPTTAGYQGPESSDPGPSSSSSSSSSSHSYSSSGGSSCIENSNDSGCCTSGIHSGQNSNDANSSSDSDGSGSGRTNISETAKLGCSECGCSGVHAVPSTSSDNSFSTVAHHPEDRVSSPTTDRLSPSAPLETDSVKVETESESENKQASRVESRLDNPTEPGSQKLEVRHTKAEDSRLLKDDIQIPVVSSSTISSATDLRGKKIKPIVSRGKASPGTVSTERGDVRRRTRSNIPDIHGGAEIENEERIPITSNNNNEWKGKPEEKPGTSAKGKQSVGILAVDSANRVLKSVNRSTPESVGHSSGKTITPKRKRTSEIESESSNEPISKSARVHTRSHTWSHKPMVTRSQEKIHKTPSKKSFFSKK